MNDKIAGAPAYSTEFKSLMERLKNREEAKKCQTKNCTTSERRQPTKWSAGKS